MVLAQPIKIDDLIDALESDPNMASVVLQRQPWYFHEEPSKIEPTDTQIGRYYYSKNTKTFPIIFSLYRLNKPKKIFSILTCPQDKEKFLSYNYISWYGGL